MRTSFLALPLAVLLLGCGRGDDAAPAAAATPAPAAPAAQKVSAESPRPRGQPLPAFSGYTLDDQRFDVGAMLGKRVLYFFFNPEVRDAEVAGRAVAALAPLRGQHNFEIVGIAVGSSRAKAREKAKALGFAFPVVDDSSAAITNRLGLRAPVALLGVDAEGYVHFGIPEFSAADPLAGKALDEMLRQALRLPANGSATTGSALPDAPTFEAKILDRDERFDLAKQRGRPVVLIFFLHTCPHCHDALRALKQTLASPDLAQLPPEKRPVLVGVEITGRTVAVRERLNADGLDFFPVLFDDDGSLRERYAVYAGVPDIFLIDAQGRIAARTRGWTSSDEALLRMRLTRLAGAPVPMLLRSDGYSGNAVCGVCHELAHETWTYTTHASAFDTLVRHGADANPECIGCHVVGWKQPGGFESAELTPELENVGCETCHGRGGPHLSPGHVKDGNYEPVCVGCHDPKHSLGFDYANFVKRVSHAANAHLAQLPPAEKEKLLSGRRAPREDLLPMRAAYVGSDACKGCHAAEFEVWLAGPHARSGATLAERGKAGDAGCLRCHTTGFGQPGGFPSDGAVASHPALARVGCEACHGPGGDHVKEGAPRIGTIVSLGDKCDSCVILQICGGCHDEANDPGFEYEVKAKIEAQRHGTLEPGTGRPKGAKAAALRGPDAALVAWLHGLAADGS